MAHMIKFRFLSAAALVLVAALGVSLAQRPKENINPGRHPNLAAAQRFCQQAFERISAAQGANEWDMAGHAKKAKALLEQADAELKQAAEAANRGKR